MAKDKPVEIPARRINKIDTKLNLQESAIGGLEKRLSKVEDLVRSLRQCVDTQVDIFHQP